MKYLIPEEVEDIPEDVKETLKKSDEESDSVKELHKLIDELDIKDVENIFTLLKPENTQLKKDHNIEYRF